MPDDRPVSPEERLRWENERLRVWLRLIEATTDHESGYYALHGYDAPTVEEIERGRRFPEHTHPTALSTPAGPPGVPYDDDWRDNDEAQALIDAAAPSPREEAVEAAAKAMWALDGNDEDRPWDSAPPTQRDHYRADARLVADAYLSAARPSSPTPEEPREPTREHMAHVMADTAYGLRHQPEITPADIADATERALREWGFDAAANRCDKAATTKEGR